MVEPYISQLLMRLAALLLIFGGIIEASHRHYRRHGRNRPIYVSEGSSIARSNRRSRYHISSTSYSTSSSTEYSTETSWDGTVSRYSFDPSNSSVYSSRYSSDSLEQSVISTLQQSLLDNPEKVRTTQANAEPAKRQSVLGGQRDKETKLFEEMVKRHSTGGEMASKRLSTREQTAQIQGPPRSQVGEARRSSILRRPTRESEQQQPHYLYTSYHDDESDPEQLQSIPSDQSYTIEFSSEHHRRFRRHISRSRNNPAAIPAILAQPDLKTIQK